MTKPIITQAQTLAEYDPPIFMLPVRLKLEDGKLTKIPTLPWSKEPIDFGKLLKALNETNGLAVDLARSGLVVIDVDSYKDECNFDDFLIENNLDMPLTWKINSGSGGTHYIFGNPHDLRFKGQIPGVSAVDIKATGIEVIAPSKFKDRVYSWDVGPYELEDGPAPVPQWLVEWCGKAEGDAGGMGANLRMKAAARSFQDNMEVLDQLAAAPNNIDDREEWLKIAFGLFFEFQDTPEEGRARDVFLSWSAKWDDSEKAVENAVTTWDSLPRIGEMTTDNPATIGTVRKYLNDLAHPPVKSLQEMRQEAVKKEREAVDQNSEKVQATSYAYTYPKTAPPRQWVHGTDALKGEVTMIAAPGGVGKSSTVLVMALAMASGQPLLNCKTYGKRRVMLWSGEDSRVEMDRRIIAAMKKHGLTLEDLGDRLHVVTHSDVPLDMVREVKVDGQQKRMEVNKIDVDFLIKYMREYGIEVASFDPLVSVHQSDENNNSDATIVTEAFKEVARKAEAAVILVHHVSKGALRDDSRGDAADAARGATAWVNASRVTLALKQMEEVEAERYGLKNPSDYVEVVEAKANSNRRGISGRRYMMKVSVNIGNADEVYKDGDDVGVVVPFTPSGAMELSLAERLMSVVEILREQDRFAQEKVGTGYVFKHESSGHWAGYAISKSLEMPIGEHTSKDKRSKDENRNRDLIKAYLDRLIDDGYVAYTQHPKANRVTATSYGVVNDRIFDLVAELNALKKASKKCTTKGRNAPLNASPSTKGGAGEKG